MLSGKAEPVPPLRGTLIMVVNMCSITSVRLILSNV